MQIETRTSYIIGAMEFDSEQKARDWLRDQVGNTIDQALSNNGKVISPGDAIAVNQAIMGNAATLSILLAAYHKPVVEGN